MFILPRPAFCWVTTEEAMLSLNRWSLIISCHSQGRLVTASAGRNIADVGRGI